MYQLFFKSNDEAVSNDVYDTYGGALLAASFIPVSIYVGECVEQEELVLSDISDY